jgi:hypothetical protein
MTRRKSLRSQLYRAVRDLGKPRAVRDGGVKGLAKRDARRIASASTEGSSAAPASRTPPPNSERDDYHQDQDRKVRRIDVDRGN